MIDNWKKVHPAGRGAVFIGSLRESNKEERRNEEDPIDRDRGIISLIVLQWTEMSVTRLLDK